MCEHIQQQIGNSKSGYLFHYFPSRAFCIMSISHLVTIEHSKNYNIKMLQLILPKHKEKHKCWKLVMAIQEISAFISQKLVNQCALKKIVNYNDYQSVVMKKTIHFLCRLSSQNTFPMASLYSFVILVLSLCLSGRHIYRYKTRIIS